ncbi:hypothetical protein RJ639_017491 [Escallonia herrerae]|uniref:ABC transmembrane type-1 domain-containing protein n=1 Tax=Escallonia herrerae TaxID=1293975 RepID=A0AA88VCX3_9ASTE|nr:hypothetical protein RJ639_017491 [Escallonia herrerae]
MGRKGGMFQYADGVDKLLMLFGTLGCVGDGLMSPLTMIVLSDLVNVYGKADISISSDVVNKHALRLLYVAIGVGISAFVEGFCWTRTAERQTSRMRMKYLKSVLRQEVAFFDTQAASSSNFHVVTTISSDAHLIQDVIAEKIPNCLANIAGLVSGLLAAFFLSWRLTLASFPFTLTFVFPGVVFGKLLMSLGSKMKNAYGVAGGIAEQAISSIRTVYSYVGERRTLERFSHELQQSTDLGIKQGFAKGLMIGSMGMIFATWAFISWVGSILVIEKGETGGRVFLAGICVIMGGL